MKILIQLLIVVAVFSFTAPAEATQNRGSGYSSWTENTNHWFKRKIRRIAINWRQHRRDRHSGGGETRSVPELDSTIAPLTGALLATLVVAGYERRRRFKLEPESIG